MKQITELTLKQELEMVDYRAPWLDIGLSTEPADRPKTEATINEIYKLIGKKPPRFLCFSSPFACMIALWLLKNCKQLGEKIWDQLEGQLRDQVGDQLGGQLWGQVGGQLWDQLRDQLGDQLRDQLWGQLGGQLWDQLGNQLRGQLWDQVGGQLAKTPIWNEDFFRGTENAYWIAFYKFSHEVLGTTYDAASLAKLNLWADISQSCGWWWPYENFCVVSDRPKTVSFRGKRLHCEDGPAIEFRDGYKLWAWNGARVPEKVIMHPETITRKDLMSEKNSEVSRVIAEKLGWDRYMELADTVLVDKWFDPAMSSHYELWDFKQRWERTPRLLKMESPELNDGTRPHYIEPVPPEVKTCQAARRWQCDPARPEVGECNRNPALMFEVEA